MILNTQLVDTTYEGFATKELIVSYIDKNGDVAFLQSVLHPSELFKWDYAKGREIPDKTYRSWDDKPIVKVPLKQGEQLPVTRVHEIIYQLAQVYPEYQELFKLNMPKIGYCDIEVMVGEDGFPEASEAKNRVNTIAYVEDNKVVVLGMADLTQQQIESIQKRINKHCESFDTTYEFSYVFYDDERRMLYEFMKNYVAPISALTGWNFVRYDFLYLCNRCKLLGLDISWLSPTGEWFDYSLVKLYNKKGKSEKVKLPKHKLIYDYMEVYQKWDTAIYPHDSLKLDDVGEATVGVRKVQHSMGFNEMWEKDPDGYVFYNAVDTILVREIDLKLKTGAIFYALGNLIHCEIMIAFSPVQSLQIFQTEYILRDGKVFTSAKKEEKESEGYEGAFVFDPIPGAYRNVVALDFASLYPTTMRQFNISPDTFVCKDKNRPRKTDEIKCKSGAVYKRDVEGILPKILTDVYNQRKQYKAEMKIATQEMYDLKAILEKRLGAVSI